MMVEKAAVRKREKEGEGGRRSGKTRVVDQTVGMTERASTPSSIWRKAVVSVAEARRADPPPSPSWGSEARALEGMKQGIFPD
jgi:hypothetical protein